MKVLAVDESRNISQVLSSYIKLFGRETDEANNRREAIQRLQNSQYNIVITDSEIINEAIQRQEVENHVKGHREVVQPDHRSRIYQDR
jgi:CheY-like chemotaxis protein